MPENKFKDYKHELVEFLETIKKIDYPKPSELHSKILTATLKKQEQIDNFLDFIKWWDLELFRDIDFKKSKFNGQNIMSLAEQTYVAIAKNILKGEPVSYNSNGLTFHEYKINNEALNFYISVFESLASKYQKFDYITYYLGKFYFQKEEKEKAWGKFIDFAKKDTSKFWIWNELSKVMESKHDKLICLSKALSLNNPPKMLVSVRKALIYLLIDLKYYKEAKTETEILISTYNKEGWHVPAEISNITKNSWYAKTEPS
ncbi:MAG: DUF7017 domain-containing protein, partial [Bacteroidota bacterium]